MVETVDDFGPCDVIEAEFVFGPVRCLIQTDLITRDDGETFRICAQHARQAAAQPT